MFKTCSYCDQPAEHEDTDSTYKYLGHGEYLEKTFYYCEDCALEHEVIDEPSEPEEHHV